MPSLPTLGTMPTLRVALVTAGAVASLLSAGKAVAQNGSIQATATVLGRPLSLLDVSRTAVPGELRMRIDGCGAGAITVDSRDAGGALRRNTRLALPASAGCGVRSVAVQLSVPTNATEAFLVSLEQSSGMVSPSFAQFVVPAAVAFTGIGSTLGY